MHLFQKKLIYLTLFLALASIALAPLASHAQIGKLKDIGGRAYGVTGEPESPAATAGRVINVALSVVGLVFLVLMLYGGYLWMTARGKEERLNKAKDTIEASIIGLIIVLAAYGITYYVVSRIVASTAPAVTTTPP